jgi:hypothetical protein
VGSPWDCARPLFRPPTEEKSPPGKFLFLTSCHTFGSDFCSLITRSRACCLLRDHKVTRDDAPIELQNAPRLSDISHLAIRIYFDKSKQLTKANGVSIELTLGFQDTISPFGGNLDCYGLWASRDDRSGLSIQGTTLRARLAAKFIPRRKSVAVRQRKAGRSYAWCSIFCARARYWRASTIGDLQEIQVEVRGISLKATKQSIDTGSTVRQVLP